MLIICCHPWLTYFFRFNTVCMSTIVLILIILNIHRSFTNSLSTSQLVHYYIAVIRPVLEYCIPAWHYALTKAQTQQLEALQKRAIHIIYSSFTRGMPYMSMLSVANFTTLATRRELISKKFFAGNTEPSSCLHHLPAPKEQSLTSRLRSYEKFPRVFTRTKRYCSFLQYALNHFQVKISNS